MVTISPELELINSADELVAKACKIEDRRWFILANKQDTWAAVILAFIPLLTNSVSIIFLISFTNTECCHSNDLTGKCNHLALGLGTFSG